MEFLQPYGIYFIVLGALLVIAGIVMGYLTVLPSPTKNVELPNVVGSLNSNSDTVVSVATVTPQDDLQTSVLTEEVKADAPIKVTQMAEPVKAPNTSAQQITGTINLAEMAELEKLASLLEKGIITKEEFAALKQNMLNKSGQ